MFYLKDYKSHWYKKGMRMTKVKFKKAMQHKFGQDCLYKSTPLHTVQGVFIDIYSYCLFWVGAVTWIFTCQESGRQRCLHRCLDESMSSTYLCCFCRDFQNQKEETVILHSLYCSFTRLPAAERNEGRWFHASLRYKSHIIMEDVSWSVRSMRLKD